MLLVGDIGGTKTELAIFNSVTELRTPVADKRYPSQDYQSLEEIIQAFQNEFNVEADRACFGVAGPVVNDQATITNLPWVIDAHHLRKDLYFKAVTLLNDLEAVAYAVPFLQQSDLHTLNHGHPVSNGTIGVIAPGTGLGEAFLVWDGSHYRPHTSEGGHTDFGPINETQIGLLRYLQGRMNHVSYEWVCSGIAFPNLYGYFRDTGPDPESSALVEQFAQQKDHTPIIVNGALANPPDPICKKAVDIFIEILGAEAGNLALKVLATGGIYIGGGIPPRLLPLLQQDLFMQAFLHKGRFSEILKKVPIRVILNGKTGLLGCAYRGFEMEASLKTFSPS